MVRALRGGRRLAPPVARADATSHGSSEWRLAGGRVGVDPPREGFCGAQHSFSHGAQAAVAVTLLLVAACGPPGHGACSLAGPEGQCAGLYRSTLDRLCACLQRHQQLEQDVAGDGRRLSLPDISLLFRRRPAARMPYVAARHRVLQNLTACDRLDRRDGAAFARLLQTHRVIGRGSVPLRRVAPQGRCRGVRDLDAFVYRFDAATQRDWQASFGSTTVRSLSGTPVDERGMALKLKEEYLGYVLQEGVVYSLPSDDVYVASAAVLAAGRVFFR